jgi:hypothetical protein
VRWFASSQFRNATAPRASLRLVLGAPSQWACYRFAAKLREHGDALADCIDRVLAKLHAVKPDMGKTVAIDGSDLPAYANGHRFVKRGGELRKRFADPDATWGHRSSISTRSGGGYYGYKVHAAVCTTTGLPVAWKVETAKDSELPLVPVLLDTVSRRGFTPDVCVMDRGYDAQVIYDETESRHMRPWRCQPQLAPVFSGGHPDRRLSQRHRHGQNAAPRRAVDGHRNRPNSAGSQRGSASDRRGCR